MKSYLFFESKFAKQKFDISKRNIFKDIQEVWEAATFFARQATLTVMFKTTTRKWRKFGKGKTRAECESIAGGKLQNKICKHRRVQLKNNATNGYQQSKVWDPGGKDNLVYYIVH